MLYYDAAASSSDRPSAAAAAASYSIRASHVFCGTSGQQRFWIVRIIQYILLLLLFPIQPPALYISTTLWRATKCHFDLRLAPFAAPISFCKKKMFPSPSVLKIIIIVETKKKKTAHLIRVCLLRVFLRHLTDCASTWLVHFTCIFAPWSKRRTNN